MIKKIYKFLTNPKVIYLGIIIVGIALRLYKINSPLLDWHSFRQADTASVSRYFTDNGINLFDPRYHDISRVQSGIFNPNGYRLVEFPLYNALHAFFFNLFEFIPFEVSGRLLSIIFTIITAIFIEKISSHYFGKATGIISMSMYLFLPFNIYYTRVILPEPLSVMLGVIGLWYFVKYGLSEKRKYLYMYSVFMALAILVKPYLAFFNLFPFYFFYRKYGIRKFLLKKDVLITGLIILGPFFLWRLWISAHPEGIPFWKWTFNGDGVRFKPAFWYWIFGERIGKLILGVWGIYPFVVGLLHGRKNAFLTSTLIGGFLYVSIIATANVRHDYYQTLILPAVSIVLGIGFWKLLKDVNKVKYAFAWPFLLFIIMTTISLFQVKEFYKINHPELIEAGSAIDRLTPKSATVIASYNGDTAFLYQTKRKGWPVVELPIDELIKEGAEYFVSVNLNDAQTNEFMKRFPILEKTDSYVVLKLE